MEAHLIICILLSSIFVVLAAPVENRRQDFQRIVSFINSLRDTQRTRDSLQPLNKLNAANVAKDSDFPYLSNSDLMETIADEDSLSKSYLGKAIGSLKKRQGAWSYDYGLGGGRFGKRNYGDYGIGGGRFGRDVDHVDLSDANDADIAS
uniref:Uncharacterized protein n=1 Tax=Arion vulgaris TaxID=1028688 RepID=A0A0B7AKZ7_9EUPU